MRLQRSNQFVPAPLAPIAKVGVSIPTLSYPYAYREPAAQQVKNPAPVTSTQDLGHTFVVRGLRKRGMFKPRSYVYFCLRCKYAFLRNEGSGLITALDRSAQPIPDPENSGRLATFAHGPCTALKPTAQGKRLQVIELPTSKRRVSLAGILAAIIRTVSKTRYPYFVESNLNPPHGITSQDLLS